MQIFEVTGRFFIIVEEETDTPVSKSPLEIFVVMWWNV
jgi:hypothetical protein